MSFKIEAFQNRHLAAGQTRVDAILSVTADAGIAGRGPRAGELVVGFIIDTSGSMTGPRIDAVRSAVTRAVEALDESVSFFVVTFHEEASVVMPIGPADEQGKRLAEAALAKLEAGGGTAMSTGLAAARELFAQKPDAIRQAFFLTDGKNESEKPTHVTAELHRCEGLFECACWGVGTDWKVGEVQEIARALLGRASLIPDPNGIDAAFRDAMARASAKAWKDVRLRLWTPQGASLVFVKQVNPTIEDLTVKAKPISPQVRELLTGAWGEAEARDFHVALEVRAGKLGDEMLAARPSLVYLEAGPSGWIEREVKPPEARLFANWTGDDTLSSRIDGHVAHYTGQDELATAIETGLDLRERGNEAEATHHLGRAVKLAHDSDNVAMTERLKKVVEVVDAPSGTVRLKKNVQKAAAMDLQLESHTTRRSARRPPAGGGGAGGGAGP